MSELPKHVKDNSCEELAAFHIIEHFGIAEVKEVLKMWYNFLEPGGKINIETPNFRYHSQLCLSGDEEQAIYYAFGGQLDQWDYHKTGFTPGILRKALAEAGFNNIEVIEESSLTATAYKWK